MERQQNIRQAATRRVGANYTLSGLAIDQNNTGGDIVLSGRGPSICMMCGSEMAPGIGCCNSQIGQ